MKKNFTSGELTRWISNFNDHVELPFVTTSALIGLKELEEFIEAIKGQDADCVRIYFLRFQPEDTPTPKVLIDGQLAKGCTWHEAANGFTQATVAMVPAKNFKRDKDLIFSADDIIAGDQVLTLMPGIETEGTGLNPPSPIVVGIPGHK